MKIISQFGIVVIIFVMPLWFASHSHGFQSKGHAGMSDMASDVKREVHAGDKAFEKSFNQVNQDAKRDANVAEDGVIGEKGLVHFMDANGNGLGGLSSAKETAKERYNKALNNYCFAN